MTPASRLALIREIVARRNNSVGVRAVGLVLVTEHDERNAFVEEFNHILPHEIETEDEESIHFDSNRFSTDRRDNANDTNE